MLNTHKVSHDWTLCLAGLCIENSSSDMQNANLIQVFREPTPEPVQSLIITPGFLLENLIYLGYEYDGSAMPRNTSSSRQTGSNDQAPAKAVWVYKFFENLYGIG